MLIYVLLENPSEQSIESSYCKLSSLFLHVSVYSQSKSCV